MPSLQRLVAPSFSPDSLSIAGICNTATPAWLLGYRTQMGVTFPLISQGAGALFAKYRVGALYGASPPSYFIIDRRGIIQFRIDDQFGRFEDMINTIRTLL